MGITEGPANAAPSKARRVRLRLLDACLFRIELFATDSNGQSMTYLKSIDVLNGPNALGIAFFEATFPIGALDGMQIVATLTNLDTGDTSEFSNAVEVTALLFQ